MTMIMYYFTLFHCLYSTMVCVHSGHGGNAIVTLQRGRVIRAGSELCTDGVRTLEDAVLIFDKMPQLEVVNRSAE
jgi:hypothetical protein